MVDHFQIQLDYFILNPFFVPLSDLKEANLRESPWKASKRHKRHQDILKWEWLARKPAISLPCKVVFIRQSSRKMDDDNLPYCFKWLRDAVADLLIPGLKRGQADASPLLRFEYKQIIGKPQGFYLQIYQMSASGDH